MKCSALALVLVSGALAADSSLPDFLPPATKVMFGIQVRRILNSSLAQGVNAGAAAGALSATAPMGADWQRIVSLVGFDPFQDIDEVLIASSNEGQRPPMLLIARGNFNLARFAANATPYHSVPVLRNDGSSTGTIALLDDSTAILGEIAEVEAAIDRRGAGAAIDPEIAAAADSMRSRYDIWGFGDRPAGLVPQGSQTAGLESIDHFQFGISVTHGLELAAEVRASSSRDIAKLRESMQFLELMVKSQPAADSAKFDIHEDHGTFKLSLRISEAEFKKALMAVARSDAPRKPVDTSVKITAPIPVTAPQTKPATDGTMVFALPGKRP